VTHAGWARRGGQRAQPADDVLAVFTLGVSGAAPAGDGGIDPGGVGWRVARRGNGRGGPSP
jgi:hypothetical protein